MTLEIEESPFLIVQGVSFLLNVLCPSLTLIRKPFRRWKGGETNKNDNDTKHKDAMQMAAHLYTSQTILFISGQKDLQNILNEKEINHS